MALGLQREAIVLQLGLRSGETKTDFYFVKWGSEIMSRISL